MRRCFLLCILLACLGTAWMGATSPAMAQRGLSPSQPDPAAPVTYTLQPGEIFACLAQRTGAAPTELARDNRLLRATALSPGIALQLAPAESPPSFAPHMAHRDDTPLGVALRHDLSRWQVLQHNPLPLYQGAWLALPAASLDSDDGAASAPCLPYPLAEFVLAPQPLVAGRATALHLRTTEPVACEVSYLGQVNPCYPLGDGDLYALLAAPAQAEPGTYPVHLRLLAEGLTTEVAFPLEVVSGHYGFQFIDPPGHLRGLMDPSLMEGELEYLEAWRQVRTAERLWDFPLRFPLSIHASMSAGYGDRRSYGGMVDGYHSGVDYRAWTGVPVLAPEDGVVIMVEQLVARGKAVLIDHGWGLVTGYWHLSQVDVAVGQRLQKGDPFARVGNTGLSTGSHLHWELWVNGVSVDATQWYDPAGFGDFPFPTSLPGIEGGSPFRSQQ